MKDIWTKIIGNISQSVFSVKNVNHFLLSFVFIFSSLFISTALANTPPVVVSISNQTLGVNTTKNISSAVSVSDADGDTISKYKVKDTSGINSL